MSTPHLLVVMGSGETTPTMVTPHQRIMERLGDGERAVVLDTPYGFQENADELSARTQGYFARNVGHEVEVVSLRRADDAPAVEVERARAAVEDAGWLFIGPGSPSYLLRQLTPTGIDAALRRRVGPDGRGVTVVSSAAAVTIGSHALPVYELYKVGADPHWLDGLGLLQAIGLDAVLVPHFDNAEGGTHDTRFCYVGERRLAQLEGQLPDDTWVLGVDEHTAMVVDLVDGSVVVQGRGGITVRRRDGSTHVLPSGETTSLVELRALAAAAGTAAPDAAGTAAPDAGAAPATGVHTGVHPAPHHDDVDPNVAPLVEAVERTTAGFARAANDGDAVAATQAVLDLERIVRDWQADPTVGDQLDRAVAALRGLVTRLGGFAEQGLADTADVLRPYLDLLVAERAAARTDGRYDAADRIRDQLAAHGVELRDGPDGTSWHLEDDT